MLIHRSFSPPPLFSDWPLGLSFQNYVLMLHSTLSRSQYDYSLTQVSFVATGYHKHVTLTFNPTVRPTHSLSLMTSAFGERSRHIIGLN